MGVRPGGDLPISKLRWWLALLWLGGQGVIPYRQNPSTCFWWSDQALSIICTIMIPGHMSQEKSLQRDLVPSNGGKNWWSLLVYFEYFDLERCSGQPGGGIASKAALVGAKRVIGPGWDKKCQSKKFVINGMGFWYWISGSGYLELDIWKWIFGIGYLEVEYLGQELDKVCGLDQGDKSCELGVEGEQVKDGARLAWISLFKIMIKIKQCWKQY